MEISEFLPEISERGSATKSGNPFLLDYLSVLKRAYLYKISLIECLFSYKISLIE